MDTYQQKLDALRDWFSHHAKVLIAFSGGVDSALVAFLARRFLGKSQAIAVISNSSNLKRTELNEAYQFCENHDLHLIEINARETDDPNYCKNQHNRCYFCKSALYVKLQDLTRKKYPGFEIINGNHFSDLNHSHPGLDAANEQHILSPLADCQIRKKEIRQISRHFHLNTWNKPATSCLSCRFPHGETITIPRLRQIEEAENLLYFYGFREIKVNYYHNEACIEVSDKELVRLRKLLPKISPLIRQLGFDACIIDEKKQISKKQHRFTKQNIRIQY